MEQLMVWELEEGEVDSGEGTGVPSETPEERQEGYRKTRDALVWNGNVGQEGGTQGGEG